MFLYIQPLIFSLILLIGFEISAYNNDLMIWILQFLLLSVIVASIKLSKSWRAPYVGVLFYLGSVILFYFVSQVFLLQFYIAAVTVVYYLFLYAIYRSQDKGKKETIQKLNYIVSLATVFIWISGMMAIKLNNFARPWVVLLIIFGLVFLVNLYLFKRVANQEKERNLFYSFVLSYCVTLISFAVMFLPFGYLTLASFVFGTYFVFVNYLIQKLNKNYSIQSFSMDVLIFIIAITAVLYSTRWKMVIDTSSVFDTMIQ